MLGQYKKIILITLFAIFSVSSYAFKIDHITFNQRMDSEDGGYSESTVYNTSLHRRRYKINILKGDINDGSSYIQVYPRILTLEPKSKGIIKIFAKAPRASKIGEYNFKLQFQPISIPTLTKAKNGEISGTSNVTISPVIPMKGYIGEINFTKAIKFEDIKVTKNPKGEGVLVSGKLSNESFTGIDFAAEAYGKNNYLYGSTYVADLEKNIKNKIIVLEFPKINKVEDLKKIVFYRTPTEVREVIKEIKLAD